MSRVLTGLIAVVLLLCPTVGWAQPEPAATVQQLASLLNQNQLDSVAAQHPTEPGRFVAALHLPGSQLLLISAKYSVPVLLKEHIVNGRYRDVYGELHAGGDLEGRFFAQDFGSDGLRNGTPSKPTDLTWRDGTVKTIYNGDWRNQGLRESDYRERLATDGAQYTELVRLLTSTLTSADRSAKR